MYGSHSYWPIQDFLSWANENVNAPKTRIFLLVDLRGKKIRYGSRVTKKIIIQRSENDQLTGHFQSFQSFFF